MKSTTSFACLSSKLNLSNSIVNADIASNAAIATTKLGAGAVLQVVSTAKTDTFTSATTDSFIDITGLSVSITPSSASNKILVLAQVMSAGAVVTNNVLLRILRNSTAINVGDTSGSRSSAFACTQAANDGNNAPTPHASFLDSPNTTSATTYKIQALSNAATIYVNRSPIDADANYSPRGCSTITVMEIKG